jgi:two-component system cell cycle response regulator
MTAPRLVIVDPDLSLGRTLIRVLREHGFDAVAVPDVSELEDALADGPTELLLVDIVASGDEAAPEIARLRAAAPAPIPGLLLLSSRPPDADVYGALQAGPQDFIAKPFRVHELVARVKAQLRARQEAKGGDAERALRTPANVMADVTTGLTTGEIFQLLVRRVAQGLRIPRCSIILAKPGDSQGTVVAAYEDPAIQSLPVDLTRYPELRRALDTGEVVHVEDVATDALYDAVRDAWRADGLSAPLRSAIAIRFELRGEPAGVFFLRTTSADAPLDQRDVEFAREIVDAAVRTLERIAEAGAGERTGPPV